MRLHLLIAAFLACGSGIVLAQAPPTTASGIAKFPHVEVDVRNKRVKVECEALRCIAPLEFFCVTAGGNEHESAIRTRAKPSNIHAGLLMLGLTPGEPLKYSDATKKWFPPHGPPLNITIEYDKDGKHYSMPAYKLMRSVKDKKAMPALSWIFAGSRVMPDGAYAADVTSYVVSIVNFDLTMIDVPNLVSSANETLEWEANLDLMPALGSSMMMIIEPVDGGAKPAPSDPGEPKPGLTPSTAPAARLSDVATDQALVDRARQRWEQDVKPHGEALRSAAQAQYEVVAALRREQQRLVDEADRIGRLIDQLESDYQQMTTPRPNQK